MPFKDKAAKRAYERQWHARKKSDPEWREARNAQKKKVRDSVRASAMRLIERSRQNDHNYRMREWERAHRSSHERSIMTNGSGLHVILGSRDKNPKFRVITKDGKCKTELLFEPLPTWQEITK